MKRDESRSPASILLVEDSESDAILTQEALKAAKLHVTLDHVHDGYEALEYLREGRSGTGVPDLILLDLNMPRMGGREFLEIIKKEPELKRIPVVVLTTSAAEMDILESYDLQANCYITKPVDFDQFKMIVNQLQDFWFTLVRLPPRAD